MLALQSLQTFYPRPGLMRLGLVASACLGLAACGGGGGGGDDSPSPQAQTINLVVPGSLAVSAGATTISATASSGLPVTLVAGPPGVCSMSGTSLSPVAVGTCTVTATQAGNPQFAAAPAVLRDVSILPDISPSVSISSISLAQSHVFPVNDPALVLVSGKQALVVVDPITTNTAEPKPPGNVEVRDSGGTVIGTIPLTVPTGAIGTTAPNSPSFTTAYSAVIPGNMVMSGIQLAISLDNGQPASVVSPRVGGGVPITLVGVPVQMSSSTGQALLNPGEDLQALAPMSRVDYSIRAPFVSANSLPASEPDWLATMSNVLSEIQTLKMLEAPSSPNTYYYGFLPKSTFGVIGLAYVPGNAAVGWDRPASPDFVLDTLIHEFGHNLSLGHAPCGGVTDADTSYPYPSGQLGGAGRFIWGYNFKTNTFINAEDAGNSDLMGYCNGTTFSDYSYRKMQTHLTPSDALVRSAQISAAASPSVAAEPQTLMLISGEIVGNQVRIKPTKTMMGAPTPVPPGPYTLRIVSDKGVVNHSFAALKVDHDATIAPFVFAIPHPGVISSITVLKDDNAMNQIRPAMTTTPRSVSRTLQATAPQVATSEKAGILTLVWDSVRFPYLSVVHVGQKRLALAQDLMGGAASVETGSLPSGGSFEIGLSDGINTALVKIAR